MNTPTLAIAALLFLSSCASSEQRVHRDMIAVLEETDTKPFNEYDIIATPPITVEQQVQSIPLETQQLMIACAQGDIASLQKMLDAGHHPSESYPVMHNMPTYDGSYTAPRSAFKFALYANQVECVSYLQTRYPELKWTPYEFVIACRFGHLEMAQYMLEKEPDILQEAGILPTREISHEALDAAVKSGNNSLVRFLISKGLKCENSLIIACANEQVDVVQTLLEAGFDPNQPSCNPPINQIFWAHDDDKIIAMLDLLLQQGADAESRDAEAEAVLACACRMNNEEKCIAVMKTLLAHGAQVNKKGTTGSACGETYRPLDEAIDREQKQTAAFLISQGASCEKLFDKAKSLLADAVFWLQGYGLKQEECLLIQGVYSDDGCHVVYQSTQQQFELVCPKLEDCVPYLPDGAKHILILDKLTSEAREKLQKSLNKCGKTSINIYAAANYLPPNNAWPTLPASPIITASPNDLPPNNAWPTSPAQN